MRLVVSYPICNVAGHIHHGSTSFSHNVRDNTAQSPDSLSFPPSPFHVDESVMTVPPLDNPNTSVAATLLDQPSAAMHDTLAPGLTMPYPTFDAYTTAHLHFSTSPPATVSLQRNAGPLTPPDSLNLPSLVSNPTLSNISSMGPSLSTLSPVARPDLCLYQDPTTR